MSTKSSLPKGVTQEQVDTWKTIHKKVILITAFRENGEEAQYIIGRPNRTIVDMWAHHYDNGATDKARKVMKENCILFGNQELFATDINLENTVLRKVQEMLEILRVEEKEL